MSKYLTKKEKQNGCYEQRSKDNDFEQFNVVGQYNKAAEERRSGGGGSLLAGGLVAWVVSCVAIGLLALLSGFSGNILGIAVLNGTIMTAIFLFFSSIMPPIQAMIVVPGFYMGLLGFLLFRSA